MAQRSFPTLLANALDDRSIALGVLADIAWPSGTGYFWSGIGPLPYNSHTYSGAGTLIQIDKIADTLNMEDVGTELTLNYLDDDIRNEVTTGDPRGQSATLYLALLTVTPLAVIAAYAFFPGIVDEVRIDDSGDSGRLVVRLASELTRLRRSRRLQLSDAHQQALFPGDLGCQYASQMNKTIFWGNKPTPIVGYQPGEGEGTFWDMYSGH